MTPLTNGNYAVAFPNWIGDAAGGGVGAVTWGDGLTGTTGQVSALNSLVGSNVDDFVGSGGVTALAKGNYVVASPDWNNEEGAATWCNGATGTFETVSANNSLVGSHPTASSPGFGDLVGSAGVTALSNGNYVVDSKDWNNRTGAVTWGNGADGTTGTVSAGNSLVGTYAFDQVGRRGVTALANGNYVVDSELWGNDAGP